MMRFRMVRVLLMMVLLAAVVPASALHIKGGWMYYEYAGKDSDGRNLYDVVVKVYRDCAPPNPGQNDNIITITAYTKGTTNNSQSFPAQLSASYVLEKTTFSECINPRPQVCYVILEYKTRIALVPSTTGYILSFQRCCRINGIVNVDQPSNSLGNTYTLTIPGLNDGASAPENSSPKFVEKDTAIICFNSDFSLDYSATDADGDSLSYFFVEAFNGAGQSNPNPTLAPPPPYESLPYAGSFSANNPFGTNVQINSRTGQITGKSPNTTGEYVLAVGVREYRNGQLIAESRKELHVNVANCNIAAARLPLRITSCDGFTVAFENLSSSPAILSYTWDFGVLNRLDDTSRAALPTFTYPDTGIYRAKLVINKESACSDSAFTEVAVYPGFFPDININGACFLIPFQFSDATRTNYGRVDRWRWDFGVGNTTADTSIQRNPVFKFPSPGTYQITLDVGSNLGCRDTLTVPVEVLTTPQLTLPFRDTLICSIDSLQLRAEGSGVISWSPALRMIGENGFSPTVFPLNTTTYRVRLEDRGCVAVDSIKVNVLDFIEVDAGPDITICRTDTVQLRPVTQALQFNWLPSNLLLDPRVKNPRTAPLDSLTDYVVIANLGKCQDTDTIRVRTVPYPIAQTFGDTTVCFGKGAVISGSIVGSSFTWTPSTGLANPNQLTTLASPRQSTAYVLTVRDTLGCPKPVSSVVNVRVTPRVVVNAGRDTALVYGQSLQLNGSANVNAGFLWTPAVGLSADNIANPIARFEQNTLPAGADEVVYILTATTSAGCTGTDELKIRVFKTGPSIFVPNAFTPNADGRNDVIRPVLAGMQGLDFFRVYNRYGQLVFETREIGKGWNGTINGSPQQSAAFVYHVQAITFEGQPVRQQGTFVLVR